jgi:hypothetical protein
MDLFGERTQRTTAWAFFGLALAHAFFAGLRTVADFDVGWLLSLGRYLITHSAQGRTAEAAQAHRRAKVLQGL